MESIGQTLKAARERKRYTLSYAAAQTRVKLQFLELMERDDFSRMPAPAYAKGFLRMYAEFLGLDPQPLVQQYVEVHVGQRPPRLQSASNAPVQPVAPPAANPRRAVEPAAEPAVAEPAVEPAPPAPRAPRLPRITFKRPDFTRIKIALANWPWRTTVVVAVSVVVLVLMANGLARWARRADSAPAASRPAVFKKGVPATLQDVPEPYLPLPAEPTETTR